MNKVAILGGSFDPIHLGHLFLIHCAYQQTEYRDFIIIPAKQSNFKKNSCPTASDIQRIEMIKLSIKDYSTVYPQDKDICIKLDEREIERGGISYTSTTVNEITEELDLERVGFLIGDDHVEKLNEWFDFETLKKKCEFLICRRNYDASIWNKVPEDVVFRKIEPGETAKESSTAVRNNREKNIEYLTESVRDYVRENDLYN